MECRREYFQGAHRFFLKAGGGRREEVRGRMAEVWNECQHIENRKHNVVL